MLPIKAEPLSAAVHYVIARTPPSNLGYVKLNKILWYSDLEFYRRRGRSLTGLAHYTRMPQGPMSKEVSKAVASLIRAGKVLERKVKVFDFTRREMLWIEQPDISEFNAEQVDLLNQIIDLIAPLTAEQVSEITHADALWQVLENDELMEIGAASVSSRLHTARQLHWAGEQVRH